VGIEGLHRRHQRLDRVDARHSFRIPHSYVTGALTGAGGHVGIAQMTSILGRLSEIDARLFSFTLRPVTGK
jgi:hypothetical protein